VDTLLHVGLSNAAATCALAVVAAAVGYFCRRPAVRHALWLLVLLKLVTPPVYVPVPRPSELPAAPVAEAPPADEAPALDPEDEAPPEDADEAVLDDDQPDPDDEPAAAPPPVPRQGAAWWSSVAWQPLAIAVWLGGSVVWLAMAALRARRFARLLRYARTAPASVQRDAATLAARLGLERAPAVRLVPGRVSPMLWAVGGSAWLVLPAGLLDRLDVVGRRTLLAHELAHLRRRDHWVRLFELLVTALFWWHPVVWWAKRELREAEEQCCDAWVLWALPESAKTYALALVETVDFLSEARPPLPALASGMGHVHDLRRRVTMIMQGTTPRALTWTGLLSLFGLGAFLLPVMPTWAQEEQGQPFRVVVDENRGGDRETQDEIAKLKAMLEQKRAELMKLEAQMKAAQARMEKEGAGDKAKDGVIVIEIVDGDKRQLFKLPSGSRILKEEAFGTVLGDKVKAEVLDKMKKEAAAQHGKAAEALKKAAEEAAKAKAKAAEEAAKAKAQGKGDDKGRAEGGRVIIEIISDGKRQVIELPPGSRVISGGDGAATMRGRVVRDVDLKVVPARPGEKVPAGELYLNLKKKGEGDAADKRIADLEKRLEELMRAVKELRGEMHKAKPGGGQRPETSDDNAPLKLDVLRFGERAPGKR
jgi:beta-lactamase regulating signal transducer with metallopeptidase domain